jgi:hypothetical protein
LNVPPSAVELVIKPVRRDFRVVENVAPTSDFRLE